MINTSNDLTIDLEHISLSDRDAWAPIADHNDSHRRSGRARAQSTEKTGRRKQRNRRKSTRVLGPRPGIHRDVDVLNKLGEDSRVLRTTTTDDPGQQRPPQSSFMNATRGVGQRAGYTSETSDSDTVVATPRRGVDPRARSPRPVLRSHSHEPMHAQSPRPTTRERSPRPMAKPHPSAASQRRPRFTSQPPGFDDESRPDVYP